MASLQDSLNRFKKQQEKCQSTLTSIAKQNSKSTPPKSGLSNLSSPSPPVKFSNDTERLQHINTIRKAPAGAQIKRVIDLLFEVLVLLYLF
jgi:transcription initiation factor TFIIE subunit beta